MLIVIHELKLFSHSYKWCKAFVLIIIHGVKLYSHFYAWSEALCSLVCMK